MNRRKMLLSTLGSTLAVNGVSIAAASTPPLFQSPAIQTGLARSPAKAGKGKLQTRHGRERTDRQSCATARKTGDRRGVKFPRES